MGSIFREFYKEKEVIDLLIGVFLIVLLWCLIVSGRFYDFIRGLSI